MTFRAVSIKADDVSAPFLGLEGQKTARGSNIKNCLAAQIDAADILIKSAAQVPLTVDGAEGWQVHRMIPDAIAKSWNDMAIHTFTGTHQMISSSTRRWKTPRS